MIILYLISLQFSWALDCTEVDLRSSVLGPPRDQVSFGWCYAMTAADLLSQKLNQKVSGIDMAAINIKNKDLIDKANSVFSGLEIAEGGKINIAIERAIKAGICKDVDMPETEAGTIAAFKLLTEIDELEEEQNKLREIYPNSFPNTFKCRYNPVTYLLPNLDLEDYAKIFKETAASEIMGTLRDKNCKNRLLKPDHFKVEKRQGYSALSSEALLKDLNDQLSNKKIVGIGYDANFLYKPEYQKNVGPFGLFSKSFGWHASSIVARRYKNGQCEYLVRNTTGPSCYRFANKYECPKDDPGNTWVPEKDLIGPLKEITYISDEIDD